MIESMIITGATSSLGTALIDRCIAEGTRVLALVHPGSKKVDRITKHELVTIMECGLEDMSRFTHFVNPSNATGLAGTTAAPAASGPETTTAQPVAGPAAATASSDTDHTAAAPAATTASSATAIPVHYDALVHLAWAATGGNAERGKLRPQVDNITYALDAVEMAARHGCKVFVGAGSQAEYGRTEETLTETTEAKPETPYGMAKLCAGQMTRLACKNLGIRHVWSRILSSYGPRYLPNTVVNHTINELLKGNSPALSGGDQIWDFIYCDDVAKALYLLADKGRDGELYVIGSGTAKPLKDYLLKIRDMIAPDIKLGLGDIPYSDSTVMHLSCDISKLKADTGYAPDVDFEEGIRRTIVWNKKEWDL